MDSISESAAAAERATGGDEAVNEGTRIGGHRLNIGTLATTKTGEVGSSKEEG
jgi:hypothetical protein